MPKTKSSPKNSPKAKKLTAIQEPLTKSQLLKQLEEAVPDVSKKQVSMTLEALYDVVARHLKKRGARQFTLPGLLKITVVRKPATKARKGRNPFTGEEMMFKAKPARNVVKVRALKKLKDMADS